MKFYTYGEQSNPVMVMLTGSFCPAKALDYLYEKLNVIKGKEKEPK